MFLRFKSKRHRMDFTRALEWLNGEIEAMDTNIAGAVILTLKSDVNKEFVKQAVAYLKNETGDKMKIYYNETYNKISIE